MKKKINVLFIVDKSGFGGVQTIAYELMKSRFPEGINIYYYFLRNINEKFSMDNISMDNVIYSKSKNRYDWTSFFEVKKIIINKKIDVLHLNGNKSLIFGILLKKMYFSNIKIINHEHGGIFDNKEWYFKILHFGKEQIDLFICLSKYRKRLIIKKSQINPDKIRILYNFIDLKKYSTNITQSNINKFKKNLDISDKDFVIGYMGGISKIKGIDILIESIPTLLKHLPNSKLVIAGDGPYKKNLEKYVINNNLEKNIIFLGYVKAPEKVYPMFDLLIVPSRSEAFGIVILESMAVGVPVIISKNVPYIDGIIENVTCLKFRLNSKNDLINSVLVINRNKQLKNILIRNGFLLVQKFSLEKYIKKLSDIYAKIYTK